MASPSKAGKKETGVTRALTTTMARAGKSVVLPRSVTGERFESLPVKRWRKGKRKPIRSDTRMWFFENLLEGYKTRYATRNLAVMEAKTGKLLAKTPSFDLEAEEVAILTTQLKELTVKSLRLAGIKYNIYVHNPRSRMFGQVSADPYDKVGSQQGFVAIQPALEHGAYVVGTFDTIETPAQTSQDCELCVREVAKYIDDQGLVRVSCARLSEGHTADCACFVHAMPVDYWNIKPFGLYYKAFR